MIYICYEFRLMRWKKLCDQTYAEWEITQRIICQYDFFDHTVPLQKAAKERSFVSKHRLAPNLWSVWIVWNPIAVKNWYV